MAFDNTAKQAAMALAKQKAAESKGENTPAAAMVKYIPPGECPDRNRIVFDDSGSMGSEIENAKKGVVEYLRNCIPNQTAVGINWMNTKPAIPLTSNLIALASQIQEIGLSSGGTPFFNTLKTALVTTPKPTRIIAFTDGSPTDELQADDDDNTSMSGFYDRNIDTWKASARIIAKISLGVGGEKHVPIDTVYFGPATSYTQRNIDLLKYLSELTGGYFLHFDPAKVNFKTAFKYLAPVNRLQLASASFRAELESGGKN